MVPLPPSFSLQAVPIREALSEGRTDDAKTLIVELLRAGNADRIVQGIAADLLKPPKKAKGRQRALPRHWLDIGERFHQLRDEGILYEEALELTARNFGYSESHVRGAITRYDRAKDDHDEATRE